MKPKRPGKFKRLLLACCLSISAGCFLYLNATNLVTQPSGVSALTVSSDKPSEEKRMMLPDVAIVKKILDISKKMLPAH